MTIQHNYTFAAALNDALKVNWRVEDLIGGEKTLDFTKPFLPQSLARTDELDFLSERERLLLNQIRGATYLHLFGLVEEFILPFALDRVKDEVRGDKTRTRAILTFAEEEAKHQELFESFLNEFRRHWRPPFQLIGPATDIADAVLSNSQLSVAILILHLEWLTQRHYLESVRTDEHLDPQFVSLLKHHWQEEAQHAKIDTLVAAELASKATPAEIERAIDDFLSIGGLLDGGLQQQVKFDSVALERASGRHLTDDERATLETQQLRSYRWTFLVSGLEQNNFARAIEDLSPSGHERVNATAYALSAETNQLETISARVSD